MLRLRKRRQIRRERQLSLLERRLKQLRWLHWVLAVVFNGDQFRKRRDRCPGNLALLWKLSLKLARLESSKGSMRGKLKRAGWDNDYLATILSHFTKIQMQYSWIGDARPLPSLMAYPYHRLQGPARPQIQPPADGPRGTMPKSRHRKNAHAHPHHPRPMAIQPQARKMTHHDSPPGDDNPRMTQNDSLCKAPNPGMTQNDSLCKASMPQMSQNDSHFEVSSFEMTQNDSFTGLKCPTEHPLSPADEPPATPPSP